MENNNNRRFYVRTYLYKYFYVCSDFLTFIVDQVKSKAHAIFARYQASEAMFVCQSCLKHLRQHVTEERSYFFDEAKKLLIQYYIPVTESAREMKVENNLSFVTSSGIY